MFGGARWWWAWLIGALVTTASLTRAAEPATVCADNTPSACANGPGVGPFGYACPAMMMLTDVMVHAAREDGLEADFVYAVAGSATDESCGKCFQVQLLDAEREWRPDFKQLVVQVINSGFDVMPYQFDLFMGAGGFGYFTACNSDCTQRACQGGPCAQGMFRGTFRQWVDAEYDDPNLCYSGGIKWLNRTSIARLWGLCSALDGSPARMNQTNASIHLRDSCFRTNRQLYHQNFVATRSSPVRCPPALTRVTGLRRTDDASLPAPAATLPLPNTCQGARDQGHYCITTMQDCCKPSCAWSGKIPGNALDPLRACVRTCDRAGVSI